MQQEKSPTKRDNLLHIHVVVAYDRIFVWTKEEIHAILVVFLVSVKREIDIGTHCSQIVVFFSPFGLSLHLCVSEILCFLRNYGCREELLFEGNPFDRYSVFFLLVICSVFFEIFDFVFQQIINRTVFYFDASVFFFHSELRIPNKFQSVAVGNDIIEVVEHYFKSHTIVISSYCVAIFQTATVFACGVLVGI